VRSKRLSGMLGRGRCAGGHRRRLGEQFDRVDEELSSLHPSNGDLGPWHEGAARLRAEAVQARAELVAQAEAIGEEAANRTPTHDGHPASKPSALQNASALFEWALAETKHGRSRAMMPTQSCGRSSMA
jgi:hypothetical protein